MQRFARLLCCFYWFHPLVWICLAEMKRAGEEACDDVVLSSGIPAPEYAAQLLEVIRIMKLNVPGRCNKGPVSVSMATAKPAQIQSRMRTILEPVRSRSGIRRSTLIAAGAIALCLAPLGAMHVFAQSTSPSTAQSGTGGATSYKHTEESHTASQANSTKPSSASQSAATKRLAAQLKRQAAQIAEQQREIQTLRKAVEMARVEAKTNAAMALKLKQADEQFYAANVRLQNEKSELDNETGKLNLQRRALSDAFATRGADTAEAKKELALRQAEIDDLMTNLVRSKALNSVGAVAASDLAAAKANIEHLQADLLKRQAELSRNAGAGAIVNLDTQKLRAELEAAMANLESLRAQYNGGAISKRELDTALAEKAKAKAELEKALDQLDRAKQEAEAAQKAAQDQTQKKPQ